MLHKYVYMLQEGKIMGSHFGVTCHRIFSSIMIMMTSKDLQKTYSNLNKTAMRDKPSLDSVVCYVAEIHSQRANFLSCLQT